MFSELHKLNFSISFLAIVLASVFLSSLPAKAAETILVSTTGTNSSTCGISANPPCQTVEYAVEQRAQDGDLVSINDGTYAEAQIAVPEGVSLTSTNQDKTSVMLKTSSSLWDPFLYLSTAIPGSVGNQTISYLTINGTNGSYSSKFGIQIKNRNDVRIHHCDILNFKGTSTSYGVEVISTQIAGNNNWWDYWPADPQAIGVNTNIDALWPINPVQNFELDNNSITNCGYKDALERDLWSPSVGFFNIKNSSIHHNVIDSGDSSGEPIGATNAFADNVDIYNNTLTMGRIYTDRSSYPIELWLLRNGCEIYNNTSNAGFSIAYGKETSVHDNTIIFSPPTGWPLANIGIEFIGQSYGSIYKNFISGASIYGIDCGIEGVGSKDWITTNITIRNNVLYNIASYGIGVFGQGGSTAGKTNTVQYIDIYNNVIDGQTTTESGGSQRTFIGVHLHQANSTGTGILRYVNVKNNIMQDITGAPGYTQGTVTNLVIDKNRFYNNTEGWDGSTPTNTSTTNPVFTDERASFIGYTPAGGSDLIDGGVDVGLSYSGSAPDLGAIESQVGGDTTPPTAPNGLSVD